MAYTDGVWLDGILTSKTKELITLLGISISVRCEGCIALHAGNALKSESNSDEILETIRVAVMMGGSTAMVYGYEDIEALQQFIVLEKK